MKKTTLAHFAVLGTNLFFAANFSLVKRVSPSLMGPLAMNVLRSGLCVVLFWIVWLFGKGKAGFRKQDAGRFLLCALVGVALNQVLFIKGLTMTSTIHASFLMLVTPLVVTIFAVWVLKESFTWVKAFGLLLGISGAAFLIMQKESSGAGANYLWGDLLIIVNAICYSFYFILVKPLMRTYSALHVIRWVFTFGALMILPFGIGETAAIKWNAFTAGDFAALATVIVAGTFLAYYFNIFGIEHIGAGATGTYIYTQPVFAVLIAILFLHESLTWQKMLAAALIFSGVYLVSFIRKKTSPTPSP